MLGTANMVNQDGAFENGVRRLAVVTLLILGSVVPASAKKKPSRWAVRNSETSSQAANELEYQSEAHRNSRHSDPDSIGHAVSHECIRLANRDVVRLATKIKPGDNVSIH